MAYPNLYSDESIVLNAQNVKVKSVSFEAVLTTRRLILVDSKKHLIAPQEILLATLRDTEAGENAIRDPTITLSIITTTGATRQMILTFSKTSGGDRRRERDEWIKALKQNIASAGQHPIMPDQPAPEDIYSQSADERPSPAHAAQANVPAPSAKKKIEIARPGPIKKIIDAPPAIPKPVETTSLPTGSFCNKCGSRVPPDSAFCNKCGTPVVTDAELDAHIAAMPAPQPSVPQIQVQPRPATAQGDKKERPIEEVIHSIEPLIEDSVPRTQPYPLVPKQVYQPHDTEEAGPEQQASSPEPAAEPEAPATESPTPGVNWPVLGSAGGPVEGQISIPAQPEGAPAATPQAPPVPPAPPVPAAPGGKKKIVIVGAVALVIVLIIAAVFIFANPLGGGPAVTTTPEPTPVPTTIATPTPSTPAMTVIPTATTPAVEPTEIPAGSTSPAGGKMIVPDQNVWIHIIYDGEYNGIYGVAGGSTTIAGEGENVLQIPVNVGIVIASIQKLDGSGDRLTVEIWKDGEIVEQKSTVSPKGVVEIQTDLRPTATPTPTPTATKIPVPVKTTAAVNETANATATTTAAAE
ncbi:zinc ribbon domain-containing protein [Methanoregula sp.]|uniref:zinc ribbon domain-containing protein n=1 Tax=Methanoregula sp. TaxID=2052170 RepID=UPI002601B962|nr:zinc ribbon domain-containing protein [Methanoregula sp.]MDD5141809.1 zinc ribbon domain-containing protein [Methanoregula sp.]